jgi:hypothetical protein
MALQLQRKGQERGVQGERKGVERARDRSQEIVCLITEMLARRIHITLYLPYISELLVHQKLTSVSSSQRKLAFYKYLGDLLVNLE